MIAKKKEVVEKILSPDEVCNGCRFWNDPMHPKHCRIGAKPNEMGHCNIKRIEEEK